MKHLFKKIGAALAPKASGHNPANDEPAHWTLGWSGDLELGFADGTYLPRKAAILFYPQYFDEKGEPIKDALPIKKKPK